MDNFMEYKLDFIKTISNLMWLKQLTIGLCELKILQIKI